MPKALHDSLARSARKKHIKGARKAAYIYGTMARIAKKGKGRKK